ncbi:MAG TPA: shikimate kinase [Acidobacteriaceae bacterium]
MSPISRIVLTGFMGSGKTTIGALLASALGWAFADVDQILSDAQGAPISQIFARVGESGFRQLEAETIAQLLDRSYVVIALGGGALESDSTRARLLGDPTTHLLFLETPLSVALARCQAEGGAAVRPLLQQPAELEARFARRHEHYRLAHQTLSTEGRTPQQLLHLLIESLPPLVTRLPA